MISTEYHQAVFEQARRGRHVGFVINRVTGSHLNRYIGRSGRILNIRMEHNRIKWLDIVVDSYGYGAPKLVTFPVEHITLTNTNGKTTYDNYYDYAMEHNDNIVDVWEPEPDYRDDDEQDDNIYDE